MDVSTIAKDYTCLQKQSLNNLFDTLTLFQDHAEKTSRSWAYQVDVENNAQSAVDQRWAVLKQGRDAWAFGEHWTLLFAIQTKGGLLVKRSETIRL